MITEIALDFSFKIKKIYQLYFYHVISIMFGSISLRVDEGSRVLLEEAILQEIGKKYGKTPAQVCYTLPVFCC